MKQVIMTNNTYKNYMIYDFVCREILTVFLYTIT
jgi:hypothetical protein